MTLVAKLRLRSRPSGSSYRARQRSPLSYRAVRSLRPLTVMYHLSSTCDTGLTFLVRGCGQRPGPGPGFGVAGLGELDVGGCLVHGLFRVGVRRAVLLEPAPRLE